MTHGHMKTIEFRKNGIDWELEIDAEDPSNLIIETVTQISGPTPEHDFDPDVFGENLDLDDWVTITEKVGSAK